MNNKLRDAMHRAAEERAAQVKPELVAEATRWLQEMDLNPEPTDERRREFYAWTQTSPDHWPAFYAAILSYTQVRQRWEIDSKTRQ